MNFSTLDSHSGSQRSASFEHFLPHLFQLIIGFSWRSFLVPLFRVNIVILEGFFCKPPSVQAANVDNSIQEIEITWGEVLALWFVKATIGIKICRQKDEWFITIRSFDLLKINGRGLKVMGSFQVMKHFV